MRANLASALLPLGLGALIIGLAAAPSQAQKPPQDPKEVEYKKSIAPFVKKYCISCHKGPKAKHGVDLAKFKTLGDIMKDTKPWRKSGRTVKGKTMPPKKDPQPKPAEAEAFVKWAQALPRTDGH